MTGTTKSLNTGISSPSFGGVRGGSLLKLIQQGEHQTQDFKYCITDSKKIARSLVAFANTDGGRLLLGVKDNGRIAGVRSEEEYYMVESAAKIYSKPEIEFSTRQHLIEGKTVLEVIIDSSNKKPHYARDEAGKWRAYFRRNDENRLANKIMIEVWKMQKSKNGILINYSDAEKFLLDYLETNEKITVSKFARMAHLSCKKAEQIIISLRSLNILKDYIGDSRIEYGINQEFDRVEWENWRRHK
ncbi:MAG TPA: ATP-binding protein [Prolixibacteraceae bacterium]|nr:ATP-binding protein [Prolixibacteraceae bacterium]